MNKAKYLELLEEINAINLQARLAKIDQLGRQLDLVNRLYGKLAPSEDTEPEYQELTDDPSLLVVVPREFLVLLLEMANWWIKDQLEHSNDVYRDNNDY